MPTPSVRAFLVPICWCEFLPIWLHRSWQEEQAAGGQEAEHRGGSPRDQVAAGDVAADAGGQGAGPDHVEREDPAKDHGGPHRAEVGDEHCQPSTRGDQRQRNGCNRPHGESFKKRCGERCREPIDHQVDGNCRRALGPCPAELGLKRLEECSGGGAENRGRGRGIPETADATGSDGRGIDIAFSGER